ncbi:TPA: hypothetical protein ACX6R4_002520 [Photobacterium damselae]|uniref:hypothetical protein n=1 Tax=Photobacterium damselae TaxID=38293 RepID=UPI0021FE3868|nr:hypothetical protein [Photobacterium damselae]ELI6448718.1 hypothetical protein [Photobacterium damselae]BDR35592.1 hypothetical protein PDY_26400 [Photobacterium damselae subsp. damselae]
MMTQGKKKMTAVLSPMTFDMPVFKTGNSDALRIRKTLLEAAPKFRNGAIAKLIGDNTMVLVAKDDTSEWEGENKEDAMMLAFLNFIEHDITNNPQSLIKADDAYFSEFDDLLDGVDLDD